MLDTIKGFLKKIGKKDEDDSNSKDAAKERLHLVLMQDRANVSVDFLDMMKQEIIDVIKKYIDIDEAEMDVRLTNKINEDGTNGAPALYANIPIVSIKNEKKAEIKKSENQKNENGISGKNDKDKTSNIEESEKSKSKQNKTKDKNDKEKEEVNEVVKIDNSESEKKSKEKKETKTDVKDDKKNEEKNEPKTTTKKVTTKKATTKKTTTKKTTSKK